MMSSRPKQPKYARNKNILVIGGSGSGKTRFFVKPNLMQMHSSYVVTDPKGTVLIECGKLLQRGGYKIKVLNTINFKKSMKYNPFAYLRSEKDILKLVNTIIANTKGDGEKSGEDFWVKSERLFYCAKAITVAAALNLEWVMVRNQPVMPSSRAVTPAAPCKRMEGTPASPRTTSTSVKAHFAPIPVPRAFATASLAAKRAARCGTGSACFRQ